MAEDDQATASALRPSPGPAHVRFVDVQKSYDGRHLVVKRLDLDIKRGEFLTLLGPSGSGKTTCLMMLAGFETPTHGEITLNGAPINNLPPNRRGIGMVFQNYALFPHMTVAENLAFPLEVRGLDRATVEGKIRSALDMVSLAGFEARKPAQLSGGQQQRVAVARALVFQPELVLMDEPLGALDKQLREQMQYEIKQLHHKLGITVVYVTHDQSEALTMSNRIAVFNDGVIQQLSTPSELYEAPVNTFVARFIGENNTLTGRVAGIEKGVAEVELPFGGRVRGLAVNVAGAGARTTLSIRPERIVADESGGTLPNRISGEVADIIYLGDHMRALVDVAPGTQFVIKSANVSDRKNLKPGGRVTLAWRTEDCRALDPS